jgi:hypothetical protein
MNKVTIIYEHKKKFEALLESSIINITNYINNITKCYQVYNDFINFVKSVNIFDKEQYLLIKLNYNSIRINICKNKHIYILLIKNLDILSNYYDYTHIEIFNKKIDTIKCNTELMFYEFNKLKRYNYEINNKMRYFKNNPQMIFIEETNENIKLIIDKIYKNFINIKLLNQKLYHLNRLIKAIDYK